MVLIHIRPLHANFYLRLQTLPREMVTLINLRELSLHSNPLVNKIAQSIILEQPSLKELSARTVKSYNCDYSHNQLPVSLVDYLDSATPCGNPKCKGTPCTILHLVNTVYIDKEFLYIILLDNTIYWFWYHCFRRFLPVESEAHYIRWFLR